MKRTSCQLLFRVFSYLSDRTDGARFFVQYKLLLGTILISMVNTACTSRCSSPEVSCYDMMYIPTDTVENKQTTLPDMLDEQSEQEEMIKCYETTTPVKSPQE